MYNKNRQTELLINLEAMEYNYKQIQKLHPDKKILPVLKASGYGIGARNVKAFIDKLNIDIIGTAFVDEGITQREYLEYNGEIVVLNQPAKEEIENIIKYDITSGVCYIEFLQELNKEAIKANKIRNVHIEIETGMGRTGIQIENLKDFIEKSKEVKNIKITGIYTHFAVSDTDLEYTRKQIEIFNKAVEYVKSEISTIEYVHCANSAAILRVKELPGNMLRPGIMLYGYLPDERIEAKIKLEPACILKSKISFIKTVEKGTSISYGREFVTERKSKIANVPIGYADGIRRTLSNKGKVVIKGNVAPIVGKVCMDSFMIDVTDIDDIKINDEVYIWDNKNITVEDIAKDCGTINYEILSTISNRVVRKIMS